MFGAISGEDDCKPAKKEPKGANKLKKLIEQQNNFRNSIKEAVKEEWETTKNKDNLFEKEVYSIFKQNQDSRCSESFYREPVVYSDCKPISQEKFANEKSLIAAFTNGRLGNQVRMTIKVEIDRNGQKYVKIQANTKISIN